MILQQSNLLFVTNTICAELGPLNSVNWGYNFASFINQQILQCQPQFSLVKLDRKQIASISHGDLDCLPENIQILIQPVIYAYAGAESEETLGKLVKSRIGNTILSTCRASLNIELSDGWNIFPKSSNMFAHIES